MGFEHTFWQIFLQYGICPKPVNPRVIGLGSLGVEDSTTFSQGQNLRVMSLGLHNIFLENGDFCLRWERIFCRGWGFGGLFIFGFAFGGGAGVQ